MHTDEEMQEIVETARACAHSVMDIGEKADNCPPCVLIMTMAFILKTLTSKEGPLGDGALDPDYVVYAMLSDFYQLEDNGGKVDDTGKVNNGQKFH